MERETTEWTNEYSEHFGPIYKLGAGSDARCHRVLPRI